MAFKDVFTCLSAVLCTEAKTGKKAPRGLKKAKSDWKPLDQAPHWLHLHHHKLNVELDIQVTPICKRGLCSGQLLLNSFWFDASKGRAWAALPW
jgi:hypothetical protein